MSAAAIIVIAGAALALAALVVVISTARRSDLRRGMGALSRETMTRDSGSAGEKVLTGKAYERAALADRVGGSASAPVASTAVAVPAPTPPPVVWTAPDPDVLGVTRRQFFNRGAVTLTSASLGAFGAACIAFLWPKLSGGFGAKINAGKIDEVKGAIRGNKGFLYLAEGRAWLTEFPKEGLEKAKAAYTAPVVAGMEQGLVALYQKCPHLGCRVPNCTSSQWFECPCHGSQYNRAGEKKGGPAPRGMDRFGVTVTDGAVLVDTGTIFPGPPIGTNTTGQEAEGPHCINSGSKH